MLELSKQIKKKYKDFNVTPQWLGKVLRDNNKTRLTQFYKEIKKYSLNKIIIRKLQNIINK